ncbi:hypothetical protein Ptr902_11964 [Pyrenophora tritici-repentis]|nr:hypothetical protein Ptr902_11964 [Pyrenophora tritici-repentis]
MADPHREERSKELDQNLSPVPQTQGFLGLPLEMRVEVYRYLLDNTLSRGQTSDIAALLLACRTTYVEMSPMIEHIETILKVKNACDALKSKHGGPVRFKAPQNYLYLEPLPRLTVYIPTHALELASMFTCEDVAATLTTEPRLPEAHLWGIGIQLRQIFELPLDSITLYTYDLKESNKVPQLGWRSLLDIFKIITQEPHGCLSAASRVKKLILFETTTLSYNPEQCQHLEQLFSQRTWTGVIPKFRQRLRNQLQELNAVYTVDGKTGKCWGIDLENSVFSPPRPT